MNRIARTVLLPIVALVLVASSAPAAGPSELRVAALRPLPAAEGSPASSEAGAVAALNEALTRELCQRLAARCTFHPLPFAEIIPGVEAGRYELGVGNVLHTPERAAKVRFSQSLWRSSSRLIGTPQAIARHGGSALRLAGLRGTSIAVERGTQQHRYFTGAADARQLRIVETGSVKESLDAVLDGRAEFSLMPVRSAYFLLRQVPGQVEFAGPGVVEDGLGGTVHIILPKEAARLNREVDAALDAMRADGTFQRILRRHMPFLAD